MVLPIAFLSVVGYNCSMSADTTTPELEAIRSNTTGRGLRANLALLDRCLASIIQDLSVFDQSAEWAIDGYKSLNSWLCHETRRSSADAFRMLQLMRQLRSLPVTAEAFASGVLAASQTLAIAVNVNDKTIDLFTDAEAEMVPLLAECSVDQTARVMKEWAARAKAAVDADNGTGPEPDGDHLHFSALMDGRFKLDGQVSGDDAKVVEEGLAACLPELVEGEPILPFSQRLAAALVEMARRALQNVPSPARRSTEMTVLIDFHDYVNGGIAKYVDGTVLAPDRVKRLLCDALLTVIVQGENREPLYMSRTVTVGHTRPMAGTRCTGSALLVSGVHHETVLVRSPPHRRVRPRPRADRYRQHGPALQPTSQDRPQDRLVGQDGTRSTPRHHHTRRPRSTRPTPHTPLAEREQSKHR